LTRQLRWRIDHPLGALLGESETWDVASPSLHGSDASHDLKAVRSMIDAGSGKPHTVWHHALCAANPAAPENSPPATTPKLNAAGVEPFSVSAPTISRSDNEALARSARDITQGMQSLAAKLPGQSETFIKQMLRIVFKFSGEPQTEDMIEQIYQESVTNPQYDTDCIPECSE
jgi:hypothetical protein